MGWCTGSYLAEEVWNIVRSYIPIDERGKIALDILNKFYGMDADCFESEFNLIQDIYLDPEYTHEVDDYFVEWNDEDYYEED